jgi:hypothetical protein
VVQMKWVKKQPGGFLEVLRHETHEYVTRKGTGQDPIQISAASTNIACANEQVGECVASVLNSWRIA